MEQEHGAAKEVEEKTRHSDTCKISRIYLFLVLFVMDSGIHPVKQRAYKTKVKIKSFKLSTLNIWHNILHKTNVEQIQMVFICVTYDVLISVKILEPPANDA